MPKQEPQQPQYAPQPDPNAQYGPAPQPQNTNQLTSNILLSHKQLQCNMLLWQSR